MKITRQDGIAAVIFAGAAVAGYFLWQSEGARLWLSDVAIMCGLA